MVEGLQWQAGLIGQPSRSENDATDRAHNTLPEVEGLALEDLRTYDSTMYDAQVRQSLEELADIIENKPDVAERLLDSPGALARAILGRNEPPTLQSWIYFVHLSDACVEAMSRQRTSARAAELLVVAQWNLYVALSFPFRSEIPPEWLLSEELHKEDADFLNVIGVFSIDKNVASERYFARLKDMETALLRAVENFQDHPVLRDTSPENLEQAVRLLVFSDEKASSTFSIPPNSGHWFGQILNEETQYPQDRRGTGSLEALIEHFFLPRFDLKTSWDAVRIRTARDWCAPLWLNSLPWMRSTLCVPKTMQWWLKFPLVAGSSFSLLIVAVILYIWMPTMQWGPFPAWTWMALIAGAMVFAPVAFAPRTVQLAWLLRIPASVSIGAVLLVTIPSQWWREAHGEVGLSGYLLGVLIFLALAFGYVLAEARGHGVSDKQAGKRALWVVGIVFSYALLVTLIVFGVISPLFAENGIEGAPTFTEFITTRLSEWQRFFTLALAASFISVVGLFSQILWDEKAITAPLAHTSWRKS